MLTELEAINIMLSAIGESPVSSLDSTHPDVLSSALLLKHAKLQMLAPEKWFNTETNLTLNLSINSDIILPSNCLSVDPVDTSLDYAARGKRLYNKTAHTFIFTEPVLVNMSVMLDFDDIPFVAQDLIVLNAALVLQANFVGDDRKLQVLTERLRVARLAFSSAEITAGDYNARNTPFVRKLMSGFRK